MNSTDINLYNSLYYSKLKNAFNDYGLANFFSNVDLVQELLAEVIISVIKKRTIRVKELCAGTSENRWRKIAVYKPDLDWNVLLTDFSTAALPQISTTLPPNLRLSRAVYDLKKTLTKSNHKFDVILSTYGFDSVWLPHDAHYVKSADRWFKAEYSLLYGETEMLHPETEAISVEDFSQLKISKRIYRIDIDAEDYGSAIKEYYRDIEHAAINFPGGLIKRTEEAFLNQLNPGGIFISGDIAVTKKLGKEIKKMETIQQSGQFAKFKVEDYGLAKTILEKAGYKVVLISIMDAMDKYNLQVPINLTDHYILLVQK